MRRAAAVLAFLCSIPLPAAEPLPLDIAFSLRDSPRGTRPVISPDGHWLAYEVRTPLTKTPETAGEVEPRFLPNGVPAFFAGLNLWVTDTRSGESRPVCPASRCWHGAWSPDSRQLAFYSDQGGELGVWIYDVASRSSRRAGTARVKVKLWPGDEPLWSTDGKTLYVQLPPPARPRKAPAASTSPASAAHVTVYRTRKQENSPEAAGEELAAHNAFSMGENNASLAAIDVASGAVRVIVPWDAPEHPNNMRFSPDGRWISYLTVFQVKDATSETAYEDLVVLPAGGGKPVAVYRDLVMPEGDYFGSTYRWTPDSRRIVYMNDRDLWIADIADASAPPRRLAASLGRLTETPMLLTRDGGAIVVGVASERGKTFDIEFPTSLAVVPLDGSAPRLLATTGTPVPANDSVVWQPDGRSLYVLRDAASEGGREIVRVDVATSAATRVWSGRARFSFVGAAGDGVVARYETTTTPPDFYLFDRNFERVRRLSDVEPRLAAVAVGPLKTFTTTIPLYDHTLREVRSTIFLPSGAKAGEPLPTIVYFYSGIPFSLYANDFGGGAPNTIPVPIFTTRGYAVLMCDVPLGPETRAGNPIQEMTDAVLAQVYRAADLGLTDIRRVAVMGHSYGGYSTAAVVSQTQLFRAAIALDGLYDLPGDYGSMRTNGATNYNVYESGQMRMGVPPWSALQRYIANSPYYAADKIRTPLLLIHGEKDGACPVNEAHKMFNALRRVGADAELATYQGEGHVTGRWALANAVDAAQRMLDFLAVHMK